MLIMRRLVYISISIFHFCQIPTNPCFNYIECGGYKPKKNNFDSQSSRIINSKSGNIEAPYPWLVFVQKRGILDKAFAPRNQEFEIGIGAGSIITGHTIITCGHCICNNKRPSRTQEYAITCPEKEGEQGKNLNKKGFNEIYITLGQPKVDLFKISGQFNDALKAYLFNYEKDLVAFSKNGDVGIIINRNGLGKWNDPKYRICLPTPDLYKDNLKVKVAGWGVRYDESLNARGNQIKTTSCQTNEARTLNRNAVSTFENRVAFWDCQIYETNPTKDRSKKCNTWLSEKGFETLPLKIDLPGESGVSGLTDLPSSSDLTKIRNLKEQKRCEEYFPKARKAWTDGGNEATKFDEEVDRIVIKKFGATKREDICFNLKKVAKYGVCLTNEKIPRHWGFCSKSCGVSRTVTSNEPYEEGEYKYMENLPNVRMRFKGNFRYLILANRIIAKLIDIIHRNSSSYIPFQN